MYVHKYKDTHMYTCVYVGVYMFSLKITNLSSIRDRDGPYISLQPSQAPAQCLKIINIHQMLLEWAIPVTPSSSRNQNVFTASVPSIIQTMRQSPSVQARRKSPEFGSGHSKPPVPLVSTFLLPESACVLFSDFAIYLASLSLLRRAGGFESQVSVNLKPVHSRSLSQVPS